MSHWNLKRAARPGYLAGRGLSVESVIADHVIAARSERAVRCAASRWGLAGRAFERETIFQRQKDGERATDAKRSRAPARWCSCPAVRD
jgi:hypothetical protein